jgi:hypothetical protein
MDLLACAGERALHAGEQCHMHSSVSQVCEAMPQASVSCETVSQHAAGLVRDRALWNQSPGLNFINE